jgi:hypothetical protein
MGGFMVRQLDEYETLDIASFGLALCQPWRCPDEYAIAILTGACSAKAASGFGPNAL